jgi:transcriptional/translational regulatory protein YebC/TACO1
VLVIDNEDGDYEEDEVMMDAMDCGADDFEADGDVFTIYTDPDDFNAVAEAMGKKGYTFVSAQIEMVPQNYQKLDSEEHVKLMEKMIEIMEDDDDVQNVWHNWEE